jgi:asparagine synthase (glutamine-hydrolysing)
MCGIAGAINWGDSEVLARMTDLQAHRGPDDRGVWEQVLPDGTRFGLGTRRLAILDLSPAGHMPMSNDDGTIWISYNGEIYNFAELRQKLESKGHRFRSHTDTEVIVRLYEEEGPDCVKHLEGMFAFAIADLRSSNRCPTLFLARDHFGIKPLYYIHQGHRFAFASEVKALLQLPDVQAKMDLEALHQYLTFLWVPDPLTMFRGIYKLPAGHYALFRNGDLDIVQYWNLSFPPADVEYQHTEAELVDQLRERFHRSVRAQMISDVPLGAFLSAGLDSSSIVAMMAQESGEPVRTYTIAFPPKYLQGEMTFDDTSVARRTANHFGCEHTEIIVEPDIVSLLPDLIWHMDEPVADPAIITAYLVNQEARQHVTVLLSGVGGDELFAGYRKHVAHTLSKRYQAIPAVLRQRLIEPFIMALPAMRETPLSGYVRLAKKMARSGSLPPSDRFLMDSTYLTEEQKALLYTSGIRNDIGERDSRSRHLAYFEEVKQADFLNQMLYLDTKAFMVSLNLTYNDKMSMAASVEVRVPFLDWKLAEWVARNVPPEMKLRNSTTKYILRRAMQTILPAEVLQQKKAGFGAPVDYWLANDLRDMVNELLSEKSLRRRGLFEPSVVRNFINQQQSGRQNWSMQIWQLLTLELWMRTFISD